MYPITGSAQLLPGCDLSYSTLIGWAARAFDILAPLGPLLAQEILKGTKLLSMDETPFKLLDTPAKVMDFKVALNGREDIYLKGTKGSDTETSMACPEDEDMEAEITAGVARGKVVLICLLYTSPSPRDR